MPFHYSLCSLYWCHECVCGRGVVLLLLDSSESSDPPRGPLQHHPSIWEAGCPITARELGSPGSPQGFQLLPCCGEGGGTLVLPTSLLGLLWHHPGWQEASLLQPDEGAKLSSLHWAFTVRGVGGMICFWGRVGQYVRVLKRNRPIECVRVCVCVCAGVCVCECLYVSERDWFRELPHNWWGLVWSLQGWLADWRPREELMSQLQTEFSLPGGEEGVREYLFFY